MKTMDGANDFLFDARAESVEDQWKTYPGPSRGGHGHGGAANSRLRYRQMFFGALIVIPYILIIVLFSLVSSNNGAKNVRGLANNWYQTVNFVYLCSTTI
jgi:hypothetical protein